ncbi:MAG: DUF4198 domain-containing protein [Pseudomonadota bacterium]|nr:DUF4198 domain-containing protein [Pseudomonadota bacterium]
MKRVSIGFGVIAAMVSASAASAHDFFLLPTQFIAPGKDPVAIQATVGSSFPTPEIVVPADRADQLQVSGPGKPHIHIAGAGEKALNLAVSGAKPGLLVAVAGSKPRDVDYAEDRIPLILGEYRVAPEAAAAVEALPRPRSWKVVSRRFAKTMICVETCRDRTSADKSFGGHLEFIGSRTMAEHFTLLAHGKPLANYPIDLVDQTGKRQHLVTDGSGSIHLPNNARGTMMLFAAKLEPPKGAERFTLDLTSLTFNRP